MNFPFGDKPLKIGILGMTEGNAHPFSWSAIINGYDKDEMYKWTHELYPTIPEYLNRQPRESFGIDGVRVTHVCFSGYEDRKMAENCARAAFIENVTDTSEDMIDKVDAVICATDIGAEHVERCRPFIEAGIPMFIDKPLTDNEDDLKTIVKWVDNGAKIISSSSLRYMKSLEPYYKNRYELGKIRYICSPMAKCWETYGMHALESIYPLLGAGFEWVQNLGTYEKAMVQLHHTNGCDISIPMGYGFVTNGITIMAENEVRTITDSDSFYAFKKQLVKFVEYLRSGKSDHSFSDTIEMAKIIIAGIKSRNEGGRRVYINEIRER